MYLKKKYKYLMDEFDDCIQLPSRFYKYIEQIKQSHKLVIQNKDKYYCENCNCCFNKKKIMKKYGENYIKCPNCKKWLVLKTSRKQSYTQNDQFCIIEKFNNYLIFRLFDLETIYHKPNNYHSHCCEYGRKIIDISNNYLNTIEEIYNNNISATISGKFINHKSFMDNNWKSNGSIIHTLGNTFKLYPYNLKKILKNTKYQYCQIWDFSKHIDYFDIEGYLHFNKFELLVKNKLYNLVNSILQKYGDYLIKLDYKFIHKNLSFIKRYNLTFDELQFYEITGTKSINVIRKFASYYERLEDIKNIKIDFEKANKEIIDLKSHFIEYIDYLKICELLKYDMKDKKILYPKSNILEQHNRVEKLYDVLKNKIFEKRIKSRSNKLKKNIYKNKKYIIYPTQSVEEMIDESAQQNNCVKTYADRVASGQCDIYFMRLISDKDKSLVTVEVRENKVVQQRTKNNENTTREQRRFLSEWEEKILKGVS